MAERDPSEFLGQQFCGSCGAAVVPGAAACSQCGNPVEHEEPPHELPGDYIPYCRACGGPVAKEAALNCAKCGVTPLCQEHYYPLTRSCALCPPFESAQPGQQESSTLPNRPNGPWAQPAAAVPCPQCGARIRQGVEFCPNCGTEQKGAGEDSQYAGFLARFSAAIIDNLILLAAGTILFAIVEVPALGLIITVPYYVLFTYKLGQTPGKRILGLQVVDAEGTIPNFRRVLLREFVAKSVPSMLLLAGAYSVLFLIAGYITGTFLLLGYLWIARDQRKRGLHDYIANTYVIKRQRTR